MAKPEVKKKKKKKFKLKINPKGLLKSVTKRQKALDNIMNQVK